MILVFLTCIFFLFYIALLLYYKVGWTKLENFDRSHKPEKDVFISVIIPARNEEKNLPSLLNSLKSQTYGAKNFEVIIVDDHSTDKTSNIITTFDLPNLRLINLADHLQGSINSYKKKAIEVAISKSIGELIVTTDADCLTTPDWLTTLASFYTQMSKPSMIIMPVVIERTNSFIGIFQALDFMTLQGVTGGAVQHGLHAMCNGANLAYTRDAFLSVNGFQGIDTLASGDDMLLMNKIQAQRPGSIKYLKSEKVIITTVAEQTIRGFFNQRIRWASKTSEYHHKPLLFSAGIVYLLNLLLLILFIAGLVSNQEHHLIGLTITTLSASIYILIAKIIIELFFLIPVAQFFRQESLLLFFPFIQPLHIIYTVVAGGLGKFGNYTWKGRKVK